MKKLVMAVLLTGFTTTVAAEGFYVQGDLGYSKAKFDYSDDWSETMEDSSITQRISAGYDFGQFGVALDYTNYGTYEGSFNQSYTTETLKEKVKSLGVTGFYKIETSSEFEPYVGVRLSSNKFTTTSTTNTSRYEDSDRTTGLGVVGGFQYKLTSNVGLNFGLEANMLAAEAVQAGANIGLRYKF